MLKWTARAFAMAAALQFGFASAQDADLNPVLVPPGPADANLETEAAEDGREALEDARENVQDQFEENREEFRDAREDAIEQANENREEAIEREARFRPDDTGQPQISERVRAATANLDIDDETRARYRWHNGEWWFKTQSGSWKFYREGRWQDFDPTTYQAINSGPVYGAPQAGDGYGAPQAGYSYGGPQYGDVDGYYRQGGYHYSTRPYGAYRPNYDRFGGYGYNDGFNRGYYRDRGYYGGPGYGYGYQGYSPRSDRYYGYDSFGRPYSMSGDRYRGGVIGSEIGGRIGGSTGAIIGGVIGAEAAD